MEQRHVPILPLPELLANIARMSRPNVQTVSLDERQAKPGKRSKAKPSEAPSSFSDLVRAEVERALADRDASARTEYLTLRDAAQLARVHVDTVARWIREGRLSSGKAGRHVRVKRADVEKLLAGPRRRKTATRSPEDIADELSGVTTPCLTATR